jgi:ATP-dependent RNA helicase DDX46/PRP5
VAYTFISKDEAHLAEDIVRVLEVSKQNIDDELMELVRIHREKVEAGEAEKHRISGYWGRGFDFSQKERDSALSTRKELGRGYLMMLGEEEDIDVKGDTKKEGETNKEQSEVDKNKNLNALALLKKSQELQTLEDKRKALLKDKQAQQIALDVGANAVKNAIIAGKSEEEALQIAQDAIEKVLANYIPSVSAEKGAEQAAKVIEEWVERENIKNNIFTCELEINEYPSTARSKVMKKEFIASISEMSACTVSLRGVFVEPNKKPPSGQKKLHLYIQGNSKQDVLKAHREIKQVLDESALNYYTMGTGAAAGRLGKYNI